MAHALSAWRDTSSTPSVAARSAMNAGPGLSLLAIGPRTLVRTWSNACSMLPEGASPEDLFPVRARLLDHFAIREPNDGPSGWRRRPVGQAVRGPFRRLMADMESVVVARKGVAAAYKDWLKEAYATQLSETGSKKTREQLPEIGPAGAWADVGAQGKPLAWIVEFSQGADGKWNASLPASKYKNRLGGTFNWGSPLQGVVSRILPVVRTADDPRLTEPHRYWEWAMAFVFPGRPTFETKGGSSGGTIDFDPTSGRLSSLVDGVDITQPYVASGLFKLVPDDETWNEAVGLTYRDATEALERMINIDHADAPQPSTADDDGEDEDADSGETFVNRQSLKYRIEKSSPEMRELLEAVKTKIKVAGANVVQSDTFNYLAFKANETNFACVEIYPTRGIRVFLKIDPTTVELERGFSRDMRNIAHWGTGDLELSIRSAADAEKATPFIAQAYRNAV